MTTTNFLLAFASLIIFGYMKYIKRFDNVFPTEISLQDLNKLEHWMIHVRTAIIVLLVVIVKIFFL